MIEQKVAQKLDDLFSDGRINIFVLAALTRRTMGRQSTRGLEEWWDLHRSEASTARPYDVSMFEAM